ncbi:hypothetical protein FRC03_007635 [Tulasnella sp. 419]|nr:hypothetical protein FRC03_007635 [Tulasnella sp. 419]
MWKMEKPAAKVSAEPFFQVSLWPRRACRSPFGHHFIDGEPEYPEQGRRHPNTNQVPFKPSAKATVAYGQFFTTYIRITSIHLNSKNPSLPTSAWTGVDSPY